MIKVTRDVILSDDEESEALFAILFDEGYVSLNRETRARCNLALADKSDIERSEARDHIALTEGMIVCGSAVWLARDLIHNVHEYGDEMHPSSVY